MNSTLLRSEERDATTATEDQTSSSNQRGVLLVLDVTQAPPAAREAKEEESPEEEAELAAEQAVEEGTLFLSVEARDPASGKYVPLTDYSATKEAKELEEGVTFYCTLYPGAVDEGSLDEGSPKHETQGLALPSSWRAKVTHSADGEWVYSLGALALR